MNDAKRLAEAVRDMLDAGRRQDIRDSLSQFDYQRKRKGTEALIAEILSAPNPQPSATVAEMRRYGVKGQNRGVLPECMDVWADLLEAAERRIAQLEEEIVQNELAEVTAKESREPAPSRPVEKPYAVAVLHGEDAENGRATNKCHLLYTYKDWHEFITRHACGSILVDEWHLHEASQKGAAK